MESTIQLVPLMTVGEVALLLHAHTNTIRRWSDLGILRAYIINTRGDRRFRRDDVYRLLSEMDAQYGNAKGISMAWR